MFLFSHQIFLISIEVNETHRKENETEFWKKKRKNARFFHQTKNIYMNDVVMQTVLFDMNTLLFLVDHFHYCKTIIDDVEPWPYTILI